MEAELQLVDGHVHMAWDRELTGIARVWPSTTPGQWWVEALGRAIGGLTPTAEVPAALALAGFKATSWTSWAVDPKAEHPQRGQTP